jgi:hypothetical protein
MAIAEDRVRHGLRKLNLAQWRPVRICARDLVRVCVILRACLRFPQAVDERVKNFRSSTITGQARVEKAKSGVPTAVEKIADACLVIARCLVWISSGGTTTNQRPRKGIAASKEEATSDGEADSGAHPARDFGRAQDERKRGGAQAPIADGRQAPKEETQAGGQRTS